MVTNQKIKELADDLGIVLSNHPSHHGIKTAVIMEGDLEKFAELIIRECIDVLGKSVYLATREDGEQEHIDVVLLEHFGIEE